MAALALPPPGESVRSAARYKAETECGRRNARGHRHSTRTDASISQEQRPSWSQAQDSRPDIRARRDRRARVRTPMHSRRAVEHLRERSGPDTRTACPGAACGSRAPRSDAKLTTTRPHRVEVEHLASERRMMSSSRVARHARRIATVGAHRPRRVHKNHDDWGSGSLFRLSSDDLTTAIGVAAVVHGAARRLSR